MFQNLLSVFLLTVSAAITLLAFSVRMSRYPII
ncbi:MAG: hypothetical protein ACI8XU_002838 [Kiritimatiellia bacterium]|jgi:hypothetical protein